MDHGDRLRGALRCAETFLDSWHDARTRSARDDLAQTAVIETWQRLDGIRDPSRVSSYVRTISRRVRARWLRRGGQPARSLEDVVEPTDPRSIDRDAFLEIGGRLVDRAWILDELRARTHALTGLNRALLRGFYEGFSCLELGERYGLGESAVKSRLHRCRARLRSELLQVVGHASNSSDSATSSGADVSPGQEKP